MPSASASCSPGPAPGAYVDSVCLGRFVDRLTAYPERGHLIPSVFPFLFSAVVLKWRSACGISGNSGRNHCAAGPWREGLPACWQSLPPTLSPAVTLRFLGSQMPSLCTWLLLQSPVRPSVLMTQALSILSLSDPSPRQLHAASIHLPSGPLASTQPSGSLRPRQTRL